jgi:hypothetical protein
VCSDHGLGVSYDRRSEVVGRLVLVDVGAEDTAVDYIDYHGNYEENASSD